MYKNNSETEKIEDSSSHQEPNSIDESSANIVDKDPKEDPEKLAQIIQDYELWGPFLFTILFCSLGSLIGGSSQESSFIVCVAIIFAGNIVLYLNSRLLQAKVSFLQLASVLGYSLFPFTVGALLCLLLRHVLHFMFVWAIILLILVFASIVTRKLLTRVVAQSKVSLVWYPILLYHFTLSFLIISTSQGLKKLPAKSN